MAMKDTISDCESNLELQEENKQPTPLPHFKHFICTDATQGQQTSQS